MYLIEPVTEPPARFPMSEYTRCYCAQRPAIDSASGRDIRQNDVKDGRLLFDDANLDSIRYIVLKNLTVSSGGIL
jgi:hypothetical protein